MHIKQFIEDAIEGGWKDVNGFNSLDLNQQPHFRASLLLDPLAWQAVGKTRGWTTRMSSAYPVNETREYWHQFIDHLANGKTIEEALSEISK